MALTDKLSAIGDAIREKTGTTDLLKLDEMPTAIAGIEVGGGKYAPRYISFSEYAGTELNDELTNLDTSNITNMSFMFYRCMSLTTLDVSNFNTKNVTNMCCMFATCENIKSLDLSNFNTSNVTTMVQMFNRCQKVTSLNVSSFDTSNVTSMMQMFYSCYKLTSLDLSNFNTSNVTDMSNMFAGDFALTKLDIRNFTFDKVKSYTGMFNNVPANCLIIVKDDDAKTWVLAIRSDFTNIKTVAEYQAEGGV